VICASFCPMAIPPIDSEDGRSAPALRCIPTEDRIAFGTDSDDSVTIMARMRLSRIIFTKLYSGEAGGAAIYESCIRVARCFASFVWSPRGSECWAVNPESLRLLQRFRGKCIRIMCRVTRCHTHSETSHLDRCTSRGEVGFCGRPSTSGIIGVPPWGVPWQGHCHGGAGTVAFQVT
jgi:hypothetical protein